MSLILDAGAFLAVERSDRDVVALIKKERLAGRAPITHGGVLGQVWRSGTGTQARLAMLLAGTDVLVLDTTLGKKSGLLLGLAGGSDVIAAALVCLAADGDEILTSDPSDLRSLAEIAGTHVDLIPV